MTQRSCTADLLRGLASLAVYNLHATKLMRKDLHNGFYWLASITPINVICSQFAVSIFFVLSGYVLTKPYWEKKNNQKLVKQWGKRWLRLYLMVAISMVFSWCLHETKLYYNHKLVKVSNRTITYIGLLMQEKPLWYLSKAIFLDFSLCKKQYNPVSWTMIAETYGSYAVLAMAYLYVNLKRGRIAAFIGCTGGFVLSAHRNHVETNPLDRSWNLYASMFGGAILALYHTHSGGNYAHRRNRLLTICYWLVLVYLLSIPRMPKNGIHFWARGKYSLIMFVTVGVSVATVKLAMEFEDFFIRFPRIVRLSRFLGDITFPLYVLHFPILMSLGCWISIQTYQWDSLLSFTVVLSITFPTSLLLAYFAAKLDRLWISYLNSVF